MNRKSIWAVAAGVLFIIVATTVVDIVLHMLGIYPPMGEPLSEPLAVLATAYRVVIGIGGGWLTARLAPGSPTKHAVILGFVGIVLGMIGVAATWGKGLGPTWYPIALVVLALPQCWLGGRLYEGRSSRAGVA